MHFSPSYGPHVPSLPIIVSPAYAKNFRLVQIADDKHNWKNENCFGKDRKYCGKSWLKAFFLFSHNVFKGLSYRVVVTRDCLVKG